MNKTTFKNALCAGALVACTSFGSAYAKAPAKSNIAQKAGLVESPHSGVKCEKKGKELQVGDKVSFGVTWRAMHNVEIKAIAGDEVTASVTMPVGSSVPSIDIVTYSFTFNGIRLRKSQAESLFFGCGGLPDKIDEKTATDYAGVFSNIRDELNKAFTSMGEFVLFITSFPMKDATVVEETKNEIVLVNNKGDKFTLDRKVVATIEFAGEKAGFVSLPLRLETSTDESGQKAIKAGVDCSKGSRVQMEIFMSEHAASPTNKLDICKGK
jgi:hypothetical protein